MTSNRPSTGTSYSPVVTVLEIDREPEPISSSSGTKRIASGRRERESYTARRGTNYFMSSPQLQPKKIETPKQMGRKQAVSVKSARPPQPVPRREPRPRLTDYPDVTNLLQEFRRSQQQGNFEQEQFEDVFRRLVDALIRHGIQPCAILANRKSAVVCSFEFHCRWLGEQDEQIEGWLPAAFLQGSCPVVLAQYLAKLYLPDPKAVYNQWHPELPPIRVVSLSP